jgi:predicted kinase
MNTYERNEQELGMSVILSGLPGSGKSSIGRELAREIRAVFLRIDSIEGAMPGVVEDQGYRVAYAVAEDNLRLGMTVIADSVNPLAITRTAWRSVAERSGVRAVEIEVRCSDAAEHRTRVEERGWPAWQAVVDREYESWGDGVISIETARRSVAECLAELRARMGL